MMLLFQESHAIFSHTIDKLINLVIYAGVLIFLIRKPMAAFFASRSAEIQDNLQKADREKREALAQLKTVEERLNKLDSEIADIKAQATREAEAEYQRVLQSAEEDSVKLRETAEREIQGLVKAARMELKAYAAEQTVTMAEGIIRKEMSDADSRRIVDDYINELEGANRK
jgi:F-type H+-transporting ATPase subunit b